MINAGKLLAGAAMLALAVPAAATTIVDTGVPSGAGQGGSTLSGFQSLAGKFTTAAATLTEIQGFIGGSGGSYHLVLYTDNFGTPGTEIYNTAGFATGLEGWQDVNGLNWTVAAGDYFVAWEVRGGDTLNGYMAQGAPSPLSNYAFNDGGNTPYYYWGSNGKLGVKIYGDLAPVLPPGVPEPAEWALLIAGFGLAGATMRVRRRNAAFA